MGLFTVCSGESQPVPRWRGPVNLIVHDHCVLSAEWLIDKSTHKHNEWLRNAPPSPFDARIMHACQMMAVFDQGLDHLFKLIQTAQFARQWFVKRGNVPAPAARCGIQFGLKEFIHLRFYREREAYSRTSRKSIGNLIPFNAGEEERGRLIVRLTGS